MTKPYASSGILIVEAGSVTEMQAGEFWTQFADVKRGGIVVKFVQILMAFRIERPRISNKNITLFAYRMQYDGYDAAGQRHSLAQVPEVRSKAVKGTFITSKCIAFCTNYLEPCFECYSR